MKSLMVHNRQEIKDDEFLFIHLFFMGGIRFSKINDVVVTNDACFIFITYTEIWKYEGKHKNLKTF